MEVTTMNITKFDPLHNIYRLNNLMNDAFGLDLFEHGETTESGTWTPRVDIIEDKERYILTADLPGVHKKNIEISYDAGILSIKGERENKLSKEDELEGKKVHRVERFYGSYYRSFKLPEAIDDTSIEAKYENGVLAVSIPKAEKEIKRQIEIK